MSINKTNGKGLLSSKLSLFW